MMTRRRKKTKTAKRRRKAIRFLLGSTLLGGFLFAASQSFVGTFVANLLSDVARVRPEIRTRYFLLTKEMMQSELSRFFGTTYILDNRLAKRLREVLPQLDQYGNFLSSARFSTEKEYLSLLASDERFWKDDRGVDRSGPIYAYFVLPHIPRLLSNGQIPVGFFHDLAVANNALTNLFSSSVIDLRRSCGAELATPPYIQENLQKPAMSILVLDIENVSLWPARDVALEVEEYRDSSGLQLFEDLGPTDNETTRSHVIGFPPNTLRDGEHIIVPMAILIERARHWEDRLLPEALKYSETISLKESGPDAESIVLEDGTFSQVKSEYYYLGPFQQVKSIRTSKKIIEPRPISFGNFRFASLVGAETGSCPQLVELTYAGSVARSHGRILINARGWSRRATERLVLLGQNAGHLAIREDERERTFLDLARIETLDGALLCEPSDPRVEFVDGVYLVLSPGESFEITCKEAEAHDRVQLLIAGYYLTN